MNIYNSNSSRQYVQPGVSNDENATYGGYYPHNQHQSLKAAQQRQVFGDIFNANRSSKQPSQAQPLKSTVLHQQKSLAPRVPLATVSTQQRAQFNASQQAKIETITVSQQQAAPSMSNLFATSVPNATSIVHQATTEGSCLARPEQFSFVPSSSSPSITNFSKQYSNDPQYVFEYIQEIYEHQKSIETKYMAPHDYMSKQTDITSNMRAILIDWLIEVHFSFELMPETLFLTINIIDRFLSLNLVNRNKLQLIGISAMLIACKYEEIECPDLDEFVEVAAKCFTRDELLSMERFMLITLDFNVTISTPHQFLRRFLRYGKCNLRTHYMSYMFAEMCMLEIDSLKYTPSNIASCAIYLSQKILGVEEAWSKTLQYYTGYSEDDLKPCSKVMLSIVDFLASENLKPQPKRKLQAVVKKYSTNERSRVIDLLFNSYST